MAPLLALTSSMLHCCLSSQEVGLASSCGDRLGVGCGAVGGEDESTLLSVNIHRHTASGAGGAAEAAEVQGRCCYGIDACPSQLGPNDRVPACKPASDRCSRSQEACERKACCRHGPFGKKKPKFCPVTPPPTQKCALGDNIRVVTDMGFDDWGAFSVLDAAGCTPQKALGVEGMMPSNFTGNFSKLLQSWGLGTQVYQSLERTMCYNNTECPVIDWLGEYRGGVFDALEGAMKPGWEGDEKVINNEDEFWACEAGERYTLLVISPNTAVADRLLGRDAKKFLACIKEMVYMGGLFDNVQLNKTDPMTALNTVGPRDDVNFKAAARDGSLTTEVNVVSDVEAASSLWGDALDIKMSIFSLETASCDRAGLQRVLFAGQTGMYSNDTQIAAQRRTEEDFMFHAIGKCDSEHLQGRMLEKMVCIHNSCDTATLDFDAIAATYLWLGKEHQSAKIQTEASRVIVDTSTAVTTRELDASSNRFVASTFDAIGWYGALSNLLKAR